MIIEICYLIFNQYQIFFFLIYLKCSIFIRFLGCALYIFDGYHRDHLSKVNESLTMRVLLRVIVAQLKHTTVAMSFIPNLSCILLFSNCVISFQSKSVICHCVALFTWCFIESRANHLCFQPLSRAPLLYR